MLWHDIRHNHDVLPVPSRGVWWAWLQWWSCVPTTFSRSPLWSRLTGPGWPCMLSAACKLKQRHVCVYSSGFWQHCHYLDSISTFFHFSPSCGSGTEFHFTVIKYRWWQINNDVVVNSDIQSYLCHHKQPSKSLNILLFSLFCQGCYWMIGSFVDMHGRMSLLGNQGQKLAEGPYCSLSSCFLSSGFD